MPIVIIIAIAKFILLSSRLLGRGGGSALPGLVAEKLDANLGAKLAERISGGSIIVTGTNGKTTTAKMLGQVLSDAGEQLVANRAGSNLSRGVVSALIENVGWNGQFKQTLGLFEVDEAAMPVVSRMLQPRVIVVLNLFRDQLDRYGELDSTAALIGKGIAATEAKLYLNADDPLVARLGLYAHSSDAVSWFGVESMATNQLPSDATADSTLCQVCGRALKFSVTYYGHIGHYRCPNGHGVRPTPTAIINRAKLTPSGSQSQLQIGELKTDLTLHLPGAYNLYNALAAAAVASGLGIEINSLADSLSRTKAAFGRVETVTVEGKQLHLLLVKNPTGFNQIIQTFLLNKKQQNLLFIINDKYADGRDVSWLWDVALEDIASQNHRISVGGLRASDMALRLKYADISTIDIDPTLKSSLNQFIAQLPAGGEGFIIPTYTAMLDVRRRLGRKAKLKGTWE